jgi:hypothetical protein
MLDCVAGIYQGKANKSMLDKYSGIRRQKYLDIVDSISSSNIRLVFVTKSDKALDEFLRLCKKTKDAEFF